MRPWPTEYQEYEVIQVQGSIQQVYVHIEVCRSSSKTLALGYLEVAHQGVACELLTRLDFSWNGGNRLSTNPGRRYDVKYDIKISVYVYVTRGHTHRRSLYANLMSVYGANAHSQLS